MDSATWVRQARRAAGFSQRELAAKCGVPQPAVARIEKGRQVPRADTLGRLLAACGFELWLSPTAGREVDISLIDESLRRSPAERAQRTVGYGRLLLRVQTGRPTVSRDAEFDPARALADFGERGVRFVLVGGLAAAFWGAPVAHAVIAICPEPSPQNAARLASALDGLNARPRLNGGSDEVRRLETDAGAIDVIPVPPTGTFDDLEAAATTGDLGNALTVRVCSVDHLVRMGHDQWLTPIREQEDFSHE